MVTKIIKTLSLLLLIFLFLLPVIFENKEENFSSKKKDTTYIFSDVVLVGHEDGERQWMLKVHNIVDKGDTQTLLEQLEYGEIYNSDGIANYFIQADGGVYYRRTELFTLENNILVTSNDGELMKTDLLHYNQKNKLLTTGTVEVKTKDMYLHASELKLDVDKEVYSFTGDVFLEIELKKEEQKASGGVEG